MGPSHASGLAPRWARQLGGKRSRGVTSPWARNGHAERPLLALTSIPAPANPLVWGHFGTRGRAGAPGAANQDYVSRHEARLEGKDRVRAERRAGGGRLRPAQNPARGAAGGSRPHRHEAWVRI